MGGLNYAQKCINIHFVNNYEYFNEIKNRVHYESGFLGESEL